MVELTIVFNRVNVLTFCGGICRGLLLYSNDTTQKMCKSGMCLCVDVGVCGMGSK